MRVPVVLLSGVDPDAMAASMVGLQFDLPDAVAVLTVTATSERVGVPAPLTLVVVGVAVSFVPGVPELRLEPEVVLLGLLPPLLYSAAISTSLVDFNANRRPILLLSVGLVSGAVWANEAWGSWWSWDPTETWALICWLVYAAYLHTRLIRGWQGRRPALVAGRPTPRRDRHPGQRATRHHHAAAAAPAYPHRAVP